ncbi:MBL fold metallo-hydrolase [Marinilongibacter aquaticus]|uniref:MBL fold metallo-hydrolase n=1 Tax=Marinilongibacter aquaticus TaxID=2975157 RepID=UPI0021BD5C19|nr:MBL fold metallo-hydrolase [Marinilongibacter aquaticus]UBM57675.1 MBL fold metallo-hydrolase [Marinilongibacter aquaticus]
MKKRTLFFVLLLASFLAKGQVDKLPAKKGAITMTPIFHATLALEWDGKTVYIDPYHGAEGFAKLPAPDLVLITHAHGDHMNKETLQALDLSKAELIAPHSVAEQLTDVKVAKLTELKNGQKLNFDGIVVEAVPMYNLPDDETSRHKKGWGNGYVLTMGGEKLYFSGDTEDIPEMRNLKGIDYAFVCMNLPYTMDVDAAADAVIDFKPKHVYPYHFRKGDGSFSDVEKFKSIVNANEPKVDVRIRNWYPN